MSATDSNLVQRARAGDRAAFEELVRRTSRLVYARFFLDTGNSHRAEDSWFQEHVPAGVPLVASIAGSRRFPAVALGNRAAYVARRKSTRRTN